MTGQHCPECGTPRDAYGRSGGGCDCPERAAAAANAAAEDFEPLRIRPYVVLAEPDGAVPSIPPPPPPYDSMPFATPPSPPPTPSSIPAPPPPPQGGDRSEGTDPAETMRLSLPGLRTTAPLGAAADPERTGGRRTFVMVALAAAAVAVIGTASFAGGLFTGDDGGDEATSELNSGLSTVSAEPDASASASASGPASASASASATASASAPKPAASGPPSPSAKPAAPSTAPTKAPRPDGTATTKGAGAEAGLRRGDSGAEVEELQRRLSEIWLYNDAYDGRYSDRVEAAVRIYQSYKSIEGDPSGVYGPNTRRALEAETSGQGREQGGGGPGGGGPGGGPGRGEDGRD
ncbi:peptidoglycan-binding protein [Streptomyces sp. NBC_01508]|uniref:peptidoglycan-binding domain-containing protein n=1 Tax=Streptomyces sp. NBC_01508 TaxID=2903888 RepID=UPI00386A74B0